MSQRKNPELDAKHQAILRKMMQIPENKTCADCKGPSPRWASTNLGVFLCISCSGIHRKLGTHISQVRSVTLDTWTPAQIAHFTKFGNARAAQYFEACIPPNFKRPPHGDTMQLERFIRDKYERKRYITIENGGQGGGSTEPEYRPSTGLSYGGGLGPRPSQVLGAIAYSSEGYDGGSTTRRNGPPFNSYGGRFGSGSHVSSGAASWFSQTRRTGGMTGHHSSALRIRPGNAMQRASTVKELINMGFSAQHAARAVEAAEGDLQKAVDWVLEHNDEGSRGSTPSFAPPQQQTPTRDLLDFDNPAAAPQVSVTPNMPQKTRPKAMDTELLMSTTPKTSVASKITDEQADFADFGAFESALPTTNQDPSETSSAATNGSLSSTIRNIYKQSPPQRAQPYLNGIPHMARLDQPKQTGSPQAQPIRTVPSPKLMAQKAAQASKKIPDADLGLTSFTGLDKSQYKFSSSTSHSQRLTSGTPDSPKVQPPLPPPQVELTVPQTTKHPSPPTPPPPDSPPPKAEIPTQQATTSASPPKQALEPSLNSRQPEQDEKATTNSAEQPPPQEEEEEEDPFAALSMMAMKSAKSKSKKTNLTPHVNSQTTAGGVPGLLETVGGSDKPDAATANTTIGIDLDELLG